jgi:hypothetical protein
MASVAQRQLDRARAGIRAGEGEGTTLVLGDQGKAKLAAEIRQLLDRGNV